MQTGRRHNMQTMDQTLLDFYQQGTISYDIAIINAYDQEFIRHSVEKNADGTIDPPCTTRKFVVKK